MCVSNNSGSYPACTALDTVCTVVGAVCVPSAFVCYASYGVLDTASGCSTSVTGTATNSFIVPYVNSATYLLLDSMNATPGPIVTSNTAASTTNLFVSNAPFIACEFLDYTSGTDTCETTHSGSANY